MPSKAALTKIAERGYTAMVENIEAIQRHLNELTTAAASQNYAGAGAAAFALEARAQALAHGMNRARLRAEEAQREATATELFGSATSSKPCPVCGKHKIAEPGFKTCKGCTTDQDRATAAAARDKRLGELIGVGTHPHADPRPSVQPFIHSYHGKADGDFSCPSCGREYSAADIDVQDCIAKTGKCFKDDGETDCPGTHPQAEPLLEIDCAQEVQAANARIQAAPKVCDVCGKLENITQDAHGNRFTDFLKYSPRHMDCMLTDETAPTVHTCPKDSRGTGDIVGCGATFSATPDSEGLVDCPECGMFFRVQATAPRIVSEDEHPTEADIEAYFRGEIETRPAAAMLTHGPDTEELLSPEERGVLAALEAGPEPVELGTITLDGSQPESLASQISRQLKPIADEAWKRHPNNPANQEKTPGQLAYERDVKKTPLYPDGAPRHSWEGLANVYPPQTLKVIRDQWEQMPTDR